MAQTNVLPEKPLPGFFSLLFQQLKSPLVYILLLAGFLTLGLGRLADAFLIFLSVLLNTVLGFFQESKASRALYSLKRYLTNQAILLKNGQRITINASEIVPGDSILLAAGVRVPADGQLISANRLYFDESILTGESLPVKKNKGNSVLMGTTVSSGQGIFRVEKIGSETRMGAIAQQIQEPHEETPFQRQLRTFSQQLVIVIIGSTLVVFLIGLFYGFELKELFLTSVALSVSTIPEGLLPALTIILALGMQKILKHRGLVRKLSAAETLGGVTVICLDKTGTLTEGKMTVTDFNGEKEELAKQILLGQDLDDPMMRTAFNWAQNSLPDFTPSLLQIDSLPFSPKERFFASLHQNSKDKNLLLVSGAPELLLSWSHLNQQEKEKILSEINRLTLQGKRLVGFTKKELSQNVQSLENKDVKNNLVWVGLLAFSDPVRLGVKEALLQAKTAGLKTIVITGDYAKTASFVFKELGLPLDKEQIITGEELKNFSQEELEKKTESVRLFARTAPDQKLAIVEALKKRGEIVAMMGDGVNDAPALHKADIGIVVGEATDVAKESADLVLLDSNFSTIIEAIKEGRKIFENIRKVILYLLSDSFAEILVVLGSIALGLPLPVTAGQILWINLVSDGFPDLALTIDPQRPEIMKEKPRPAGEPLVNHWMFSLIILVSFLAGLLALGSFILTYKITHDLTIARSMAFITLGLNSLSYVFSVRSLLVPFWKTRLFENKWLVLAVLAGFGLQVLPFLTSTTRQFFGLANLSLNYWFIAVLLSITLFFVIEIFKKFYSSRFNVI